MKCTCIVCHGCDHWVSDHNDDQTTKDNLPSLSPAGNACGTSASLRKTAHNQTRSQQKSQPSTKGGGKMYCLLVFTLPHPLQSIILAARRLVQSSMIVLHTVSLVSLSCFCFPLFVLTLVFHSNQSHLSFPNRTGGNLNKVSTPLISVVFLVPSTSLVPPTLVALYEFDILYYRVLHNRSSDATSTVAVMSCILEGVAFYLSLQMVRTTL